ncbi:hypothetical protein B566_EDAN009870 [Ephemera danica]|nr:hypothetical protein B566_EDAN009870 [Ephemera danica]
MPKGKKKYNKGSGGGGVVPKARLDNLTSDEDSLNDNASIIRGEEVDEQTQEELFEEKLMEAIDGIMQKSAQARTTALECVGKAFVKKYLPDFVSERHVTITEGIKGSLRKGRGAEQGAAAQLAPLLCVQLGPGSCSEEVCSVLGPVLLQVATDKSCAPSARAKCCWSLALLQFLSGGELVEVTDTMQVLEEIYSGSYFKGNGTVPTVPAEEAQLHASALASWSLLLTLLTPGDVYSHIYTERQVPASYYTGSTYMLCELEIQIQLERLQELLESASLEVRMAAGESIAVLFELGRAFNEDFEEAQVEALCDILRQLATDSHKYRAKKDRKTQRSSFRDILHFIEDGKPLDIQVRFGKEMLLVDSWCKKKHYDAFCQVLGPGLNLHLAENDLLRDVFELGERPSLLNGATQKTTKLERHLMNAAAFKARTISRSKNRDKRSAVIAC